MPNDLKLIKTVWIILGVVVVGFFLAVLVSLLLPFTPDGTDAGIQAIKNYEVTKRCSGTITALSSRINFAGRSEGSWYETWRIKNSCGNTHVFRIRFGVSPEAKAFVISLEYRE